MRRKDFLAKGLIGLGGVVALTSAIVSKGESEEESDMASEDCTASPRETRGPFPNKTPSDYIKANIVGDRQGIALLMTLTVLDRNNDCRPLANALVDVWHCDAFGNYSEYSGYGAQEDMTDKDFLRGRQTTDVNGRVSFISIFPGHYRGRAPHIHVEVLSKTEKSVLATQIAFPDTICDTVYATKNYSGTEYVSNSRDGIFRDSLELNIADSITGNTKEGYLLSKTLVVDA